MFTHNKRLTRRDIYASLSTSKENWRLSWIILTVSFLFPRVKHNYSSKYNQFIWADQNLNRIKCSSNEVLIAQSYWVTHNTAAESRCCLQNHNYISNEEKKVFEKKHFLKILNAIIAGCFSFEWNAYKAINKQIYKMREKALCENRRYINIYDRKIYKMGKICFCNSCALATVAAAAVPIVRACKMHRDTYMLSQR